MSAPQDHQSAAPEPYESIAWLGGAPGTNGLGAGLFTLLRDCGYFPVPLNLSTVEEETLAEYPTAVLPSRGALDLGDYGSLVVYVLKGGTLITFPEPPTRQPNGAAFRSTFLWPHLPGVAPRTRGSVGSSPLLRRLLGRVGRASEHSILSEADGLPVPIVGPVAEFPSADQPFVRYGTGYSQPQRSGGPVALRPEVLLRRAGIPIAYRAQIRDGVSTVIGADPGAAYEANRHPPMSADDLQRLQQFVVGVFG
jgi:hypothetical protein